MFGLLQLLVTVDDTAACSNNAGDDVEAEHYYFSPTQAASVNAYLVF